MSNQPVTAPSQTSCAYEREDLGDLPCTHTAIRRAARRLAYLYDEAMECVGLKSTQVALVGAIDQMTDPQTALGPTLHELAGGLTIQISALTHALRPLVRDGLVELLPDANDKRTKRSVLTAQGKARIKQAVQAWSTVNHRVEEVLGPDSATLLRELADHIASDGFLQAYRGGGADAQARPISAGQNEICDVNAPLT
ncbi:MarR family winged helix-turn-helix transcriptional regulator [Pseudomonas aeruginosa]|uniref:MarR family winged helix-turn-helix transcriptional regulator n=1 Tax=Pseudomonas aeruginosa TaxID=287 RepID=UPI0021E11E2F|nr:MarR family winged helix-turn-helix transcriptional regulator [Pseudomonas aeruginosa]